MNEGIRYEKEFIIMKKITRMALSVSAAMVLASVNVLAASDSKPVFLTVTSPDHPQTWVAGAHQKAKTLRWDSSRNMLVADVKYSTEDYADSVNPTREDSHSLPFPRVRLAKNGTDLLATNHLGQTAKIGRIEDGLFGKHVVLNNDVSLNVHRADGKIHASLVYNALVKN